MVEHGQKEQIQSTIIVFQCTLYRSLSKDMHFSVKKLDNYSIVYTVRTAQFLAATVLVRQLSTKSQVRYEGISHLKKVG